MTTTATNTSAAHLWIPSRIAAELRADQDKMQAEGTLPSREQLQGYYDAFRRRFGPEVLRGLDGVALLERMHAHGNRDSLVYWLEFKDDEEFPGTFGSIAGGSALKFGVFRRAETGAWATKGPGGAPQDIPVDQAIEFARRHRDQLIAAAEAVGRVKEAAGDREYLNLQRELQRIAPDVEDSAWGHKYLSLMFPEVLDNFHVEHFQRYQLVRLLQLPPQDGNGFASGRYVCAGRFVTVAQEMALPLPVATILLNRRHGRPRNYWRIGTTDDERARRKFWPMMRDGGVVAIGWPAIGDLSGQARTTEARGEIASLLARHYPGPPQTIGRTVAQVLKFVAGIETGDRVLAADGMTVLGVGEVTGPYQFVAGADFPHRRSVEWRSIEEWRTVDAESLRTTVGTIKNYRNQVEAERHILDDGDSVRVAIAARPRVQAESNGLRHEDKTAPKRSTVREALPRLSGIPGSVQSVLERKGQAILYGPPGTGKTYWGLRAVRDLAAFRAFGVPFDSQNEDHRVRILGQGDPSATLVRTCSFHPEYGYEDFIEGFRPNASSSGALGFSLVPGIFRQLCAAAERAPELDFYLVIDEINRGDIPRIFGELLTLLERDKRGEIARLAASGEAFRVPSNVFVVGTMNTADRSIALLDVALRRRFGFVELMPDYQVLGPSVVAGLPLGAWLADLNRRIRSTGGGDARNRQIGHAFLLDGTAPINTVDQLAAVLRDDIVPLLEEYTYDDFTQLATLLGRSLVDVDDQRVRRELFEVGRGAELVSALMSPEVATAAAAVTATADDTDDDVEDDDIEASIERGDEELPTSGLRTAPL